MRKILFRGKSRYTGVWVEGYFSMEVGRIPYLQWLEYDGYYHEEAVEECAVILDTVGEYTGLTDKNGKKIFEGDIVDVLYNPRYGGVAKQRIGIRKVVFEDGCFMMEDDEGCHLHFIVNEDVTVVGNIHDNPELLEGE